MYKRQLQKLKPLIQDNTSIEIYEDTGDFAGVRQGVVTLDEDECALVSFDVEGTDWYGRAPMRNLRIPYEQKLKIETRAEEYDGRVAAAHWVVYYPPGTTPTAWDENNNETAWEDNRAIAEKVLQLLLASGSAVLPAEVKTTLEEMNTNVDGTSMWKVELLAAARTGGTAPYDSRLKYKDVEFARGLGFLERAVFEGQFGTKAEAGEHGESSLVNSEDRATTIAKALTKQVIDNLVETNHGEEWVGKIRVKANPISDKQMTLLLDIYDKLISNQEITLAEYDALDMPQFREVIGLPVDDQAQEVDLLSESLEDDSEPNSEDSETDLELSCGANAPGGGGFQKGNSCAGVGTGSGEISQDGAMELEPIDGFFTKDVIEDLESSGLSMDAASSVASDEQHEDRDLWDELDPDTKRAILDGGSRMKVRRHDVKFGEGVNLTLYNTEWSGAEQDFNGVFWSEVQSDALAYAKEHGYQTMRIAKVSFGHDQIGRISDLKEAAEAVGFEPDDSFEFTLADNADIQGWLRDNGFKAVMFEDVAPNNEFVHDTILTLEEPEIEISLSEPT